MSGDDKCHTCAKAKPDFNCPPTDEYQTCAKAKPDCTCSPNPHQSTSKVIQTAIKPPDLFTHKEDLSLYARQLQRWSRACGIDTKLQGDFILLHPSSSNPTLHERLDRELGDKLPNDKTPVETIIKTLEQWFGVDKGVDLMKVFNDFVAKSRKPDQDLHQYTADFEDGYNKLQKMGEKLSSRLLALFLLKNANLTDTEFQIVTANLDFSSEGKADSLYEDTKGSLNKHQNCRVINSKPTGAESTFLIDSKSLDTLSEEQQNELVLWAKRKQKPEGNLDDPPPKRWRKCHFCICKKETYTFVRVLKFLMRDALMFSIYTNPKRTDPLSPIIGQSMTMSQQHGHFSSQAHHDTTEFLPRLQSLVLSCLCPSTQ